MPRGAKYLPPAGVSDPHSKAYPQINPFDEFIGNSCGAKRSFNRAPAARKMA
jgi:hypothetical protein